METLEYMKLTTDELLTINQKLPSMQNQDQKNLVFNQFQVVNQ